MFDDKVDVLVVGSGGREDAILWWFKNKSQRVGKLYAAPGNPGTARWAENVPIPAHELIELADFAEFNRLLTIVGPEEPLALGIADVFWGEGLPLIGPSQPAAKLESNKIFALEFMHRHNIPTGWFKVFHSLDEVLRLGRSNGYPIVIKNPFLAAGKGSFVCTNEFKAVAAVGKIFTQQKNYEDPYVLLVMECLYGREMSVMALTDGESYKILPVAEDHKNLNDGGAGPMTGGMGAFAPSPLLTDDLRREIENKIIRPTLSAIAGYGGFLGVLYPGIIITEDGPKVLEFNCRFGDPEAQVVLPLIKTDPVDIFEAMWFDRLARCQIELEAKFATCVCMASAGYPDEYRTGCRIKGTRRAEENGDAFVFHAGTSRNAAGRLVTDGGRVMAVTALGDTVSESAARAYTAVSKIRFSGAHYRRDIGNTAL